MKLQAAINLFLDSYPNAGTRRAYAQAVEQLCNVVLPQTEVNHVLPVHLVKFSQYVEEKSWKPATKRKMIKGVKAFFNWLVKYDVIDKSPARAIKTKRLQTYISRDKAIAERELKEVIDYVRYKPRDYALIMFLADTGCRAGGAAGLRVDDIDFDHLTATVTEKGDKTRQVAFGQDTANALRAWLLHRPTSAGAYVFSRNQRPLSSPSISVIVRRACKKVGVRSLGSHSFRHRKGHQLADNKVAPSIAATALGHADPIVTLQNYYPADWASAEQALRELVLEIPKPPRIKISG